MGLGSVFVFSNGLSIYDCLDGGGDGNNVTVILSSS